MSGKRGNKIRQIVKLRQIVRKWRMVVLNRSSKSGRVGMEVGCNPSPRAGWCSSDEEGEVREGHLAVYVGREGRRFVIPTEYLSRPLFRTLLDKAEEEYGFEQQGALSIPCDVALFKHVLRLLHRNHPAAHQTLSFHDLLNFYSDCAAQAYPRS